MNHDFTHDELNLLCVNLAATREGAILNLDVELLYVEDRKMSALCYSAIEKLEEMSDEDYTKMLERSWVFRTVGYGHDASVWNDIISVLKNVGYDGCISIEHEDGLMSPKEGLEKAVSFLKNVLIYENAGEMWWV